MRTSTYRVGGALVAALLVAPLGVGAASADITDPAPSVTDATEDTPDGSTGTDGTGSPVVDEETPAADPEAPAADDGSDDGTTEEPTEDETTPGEEETTPAEDEATPGEEATLPGGSETEDLVPPADDEEAAGPSMSDIAIDIESYPTRLYWNLAGTYHADLSGVSAVGRDSDGALQRDIPVTWSYSLNGGSATEFTLVDGAIDIDGLVPGENTLELTASYTAPAGTESTESPVTLDATLPLTDVAPLTITVLTAAESLAAYEAASIFPTSYGTQGAQMRFTAASALFSPSEPVTVVIVSMSGETTVIGSTTANADGTLEYTMTIPADLAGGTYYVFFEGTTSTAATRLVLPALAIPSADPASTSTATSAAVAPAAATSSSSGSARLATTGGDPGTGLLVGGVLTLLGVGTVVGTRRLRAARAQA
ncbi:MAG TPA: hypothetical protein VGC67_10065 [Cellulomonas sp.]